MATMESSPTTAAAPSAPAPAADNFEVVKEAITREEPTANGFSKEVRSAYGLTDVPRSPRPWGPTEDHQSSLPRLPIPDLAHTCELYLKSVRPLLSAEEYANTVECVREFQKEGGDGQRLQQMLKDFDAGKSGHRHPSWLEPFWDDAYLVGPTPIAINVNYFFGLRDDPQPQRNTQVGRAASLLRGAMLCCEQIRNHTFSLDRGLDMSQYQRAFGCTRLPWQPRDRIMTYTTDPVQGPASMSKTSEYLAIDPTHVVVMCDTRFFTFDVFKDGKVISLAAIESALSDILRRCETPGVRVPLGVFTAGDRIVWAKEREKLIKNHHNLEALRVIQRALFIVCLDFLAPANDDEYARLLLHGPGANRWFDKHNLIVASNGKAGFNFEHSVGDGSTALRIADESFKWSTQNGSDVPSTDVLIPVKELKWHLLDATMNTLRQSYAEWKQEILANETATLSFTRYGGSFLKACRMSPDAAVQVAIQLAQYKMFGRPVATYEAASTRQFLHGRTETVRSCTQESLDFCKAACSQPLWGKDTALQYELLKKAVAAHVAYMKEAKDGKGVDRHLFGLRMMLEREGKAAGMKTPAIFQDVAHSRSCHWALSTSHCGSPSLSYFGFGPVTHDGFGIGYMIMNNDIQFVITAKYYEKQTSAAIFAAVLEESLLMIRAILLSNPALAKEPPISMHFTHPTVYSDFHFSEEYLMYEEYDAHVFGY
eukprot:GGOE01062234.1.p1 GENE.GGOE01062234.1~~GGOE01062234.1.p1  ORF type:complete len:720 (+),score=178.70 GGOE01062234.1:33-2162(+)